VDISIIILAKNEEHNIGPALEMVFRQKLDWSFEVLVLDSGSRDRTLEIARKYPVRIVPIKSQEFSHSQTRNLGVKFSQGEYVVFLTADALAASDAWLKNLILPFKQDPALAGVYSRQIPKSDCYLPEARDILAGAGLAPKIKFINPQDPGQVAYFNKNIWKLIAFSNVSAAYRKSLLEQEPFNQELEAVEDQEWAFRMIKKGRVIRYEPLSGVYHSHNDTLSKLFARHYRYGCAFKKFISDRRRSRFLYCIKITVYEMILDQIFLWIYAQPWIKKWSWFFRSPLFRVVKNFAFYQGFKDRK